MTSALKTTPLHTWHVAHGAKTADFGGWDMPIEYIGIVAEHIAVREAVGIFDVSHMGKLVLTGNQVATWLNSVIASNLDDVEFGKAQYSMLLNDAGGVIDDLIVYKFAENEVWIVPNASNASEVAARLTELAPAEVTVHNAHNDMGIIAIQGPKSAEVMNVLGLPSDHEYMSAVKVERADAEVVVCRSGYTGERGYEIIAPNHLLISVWESAIAAGATAAGLGARDTLRLEMGYPHHGHELSPTITPVEAGLNWAVGWTKEVFEGANAVKALKASGASRKRVALKALERGIPRAEMNVLRDGQVVGVTTSGTFSPTLKVGIALALVSPDIKLGDVLHLDVRGRTLEVEVVKLPFVQPSTR